MKWDASFAREIEPQKNWATVTVAPVSASLYNQIVSGGDSAKAAPVVIEREFVEIAEALKRKGQAILYGPPGTGKTFTALRFAVWWLLREMKNPGADEALLSQDALRRGEEKLASSSDSGRVWWVVANPEQWSWDDLFKRGTVSYRYGKIQKHYPVIQPNDLVIGYQATPDKRIMALARVVRGLHTAENGEPQIELKALARVEKGPTYQDVATDSLLMESEPMRHRNQGTLFALTEDESTRLFDLLIERNPELNNALKTGSGVGRLTRITFHGSYSYEDFIEGFRPIDRGTGQLVLRLEDGVFKRVCRQAQLHPDEPFLVLIDEINRANLAKVFGEIVTLLERDKRGVMVTLPQSKEPFTVPPNVFVLGTMNTADRSIKLIDSALRRRFAFIEFMPDATLLHGAKVGALDLEEFLEKLNDRIAAYEDREKQIGHSFLLDEGKPISDLEEFSRRFRHEILPLLQEFCYEDYATLARYLGTKLVDRENRRLDRELLLDPEQLATALAEELTALPGEADA